MLINTGILALAALQILTLASCSAMNNVPTPDHQALQPRAPATFTHPGVLLDKAQLDFIKSKVQSGVQPWTDAYNDILSFSLGSTTRTPSPVATVACGPSSMNPDVGCKEERQDALAAYAMSLAWYITGNTSYAQKAISYMNAWAKTIKAHTDSNALLQTGWAGTGWTRAAEIIRYTNAGWASSDITAFENMLRNVYLLSLIGGSNSNGNWELGLLFAYVSYHV